MYSEANARKRFGEYQSHGPDTAANRAWVDQTLLIDTISMVQGHFDVWRQALDNYIDFIVTVLDATSIFRTGITGAAARFVSFMDVHHAGTSSLMAGPLLAETSFHFSDEIISAMLSLASRPLRAHGHSPPDKLVTLFDAVPRLDTNSGSVIPHLVSDARITAL